MNDYYATDPRAIDLLCEVEQFSPTVWEPACGQGHLSKRLEAYGYTVKSTDLIDRGYGQGGIDFFKCNEPFDGDIITNPPYKYAKEFVEKAVEIVTDGHKVAMFLKVQFLEGKSRKTMFKSIPPKTIYISSSRLRCARNGDFVNSTGNAVAYAWFVWEKDFKGDPIVRWVN